MRVLEVDDVLATHVEVDVRVDLGLLRAVDILAGRENATVSAARECLQQVSNRLTDDRHESAQKHGLHDVVSDETVPARVVVTELAIKEPTCRLIDLFEIGVDKEDQDCCVEELSREDTVRNLCQHLGMGVVANPGDQADRNCRQNLVDKRDDDGDAVRRVERRRGGAYVILADRILVLSVQFRFGLVRSCHIVTEALDVALERDNLASFLSLRQTCPFNDCR